MKILCIADSEDERLISSWSTVGKARLEGVELILSAGDLKPYYLEFLVTMLNVPCLYVRGNHDMMYHDDPPLGCVCIEDEVAVLYEDPETGYAILPEKDFNSRLRRAMKNRREGSAFRNGCPEGRMIRVAGLGGSMRYHEGRDMYTEKEMEQRVQKLMRRKDMGLAGGSRLFRKHRTETLQDTVDILLTHAPCLGYGDLDDLPHKGFACFNELLDRWHPAYHLYGHVHMEYGMIEREAEHRSGTRLINVSGMYILDI